MCQSLREVWFVSSPLCQLTRVLCSVFSQVLRFTFFFRSQGIRTCISQNSNCILCGEQKLESSERVIFFKDGDFVLNSQRNRDIRASELNLSRLKRKRRATALKKTQCNGTRYVGWMGMLLTSGSICVDKSVRLWGLFDKTRFSFKTRAHRITISVSF